MPSLDRNHSPSIPFGSSKKTSKKNLKNSQKMFSSAPRPFVLFLLAAACCLVVDSCFAAATKHHKKEKEPTAKKHAGPKLMDETSRFSKCNAAEDVRIHDFEVETLKGDYVDLNAYKGQIVLVVNVASFCAFTQQYNDFNPLIEKNLAMGRNFSILAFPCNQFHLQEPAENQEILNGLAHVRPGDGWKPHQNLHIFGKVDVNGDDHIPLFEFLKDSCPETVKRIGTKEEMFYNPIRSNDITWNFEKFLVDAEGRPRFRFHPTVWQHGRVIQKYIDILAAEGGSEKAAKQENELAKSA